MVAGDAADLAAQAAANQAAQVPAPTTFYLSPWEANINLTTKEGRALWDEGTKPIYTLFSGNGKDLLMFLADIKNRSKKCFWSDELLFGPLGHRLNLLTEYGQITLEKVKQDRDARNASIASTHEEQRPKINALMMYHFIYDSLGERPRKKISTRLEEIENDGPTLLKIVLDDTFVATKTTTFTTKESLYNLSLKAYRFDVLKMNQNVREKLLDLQAVGFTQDNEDLVIHLFRAYQTATNQEFLTHIEYLKNEWTSGRITNPDDLMAKAETKYDELSKTNKWKQKSAKDDHIVALAAQLNDLKTKLGTTKPKKPNDPKKPQRFPTPPWKFDRSLSTKLTYEHEGKEYHWCEGPGHNKVGMWSRHKPSACKDYNVAKTHDITPPNLKPKPDPAKTRAAFMATLAANNSFGDDVTGMVDTLMAVLQE
jgi:hypothetical protein